MIKNYLKSAWRSLLKEKQSTFLNLLGLSSGIACALLIFLWVQDEMSFDKFFPNDSQIYQLMENRKTNGEIGVSDESSGLLSQTLKIQIPEIEYASPLAPPDWFQKFTISVGNRNFKAIGQYAGKDYFNIFSFPLIEGDRNNLLSNKNSIVISDELAQKLFNTTHHLIGNEIRIEHDKDFLISGIFKKIPYHSSQQFDFVLPFDYLAESPGQSWVKTWNNTGPHNFVRLKKGTDIGAFNKKIANVITLNGGDTTRSAFAAKFSDNYLLNTFNHGARVGGRKEYVKLFSLIAVFILVIACINFMNLSTAKSLTRMKEVGIRKTIGGTRSQLVLQFLAESIILVTISMIVAIGITYLLLPPFNLLTGKQIHLHLDFHLILALTGLTLLTGLLSGCYPAFYLSGFNPLTILKGKISPSASATLLRKGLVIFQFSLSILLIVSVLIIYRQIQFIQSTDPGYNKDNVIRFDSEGKIKDNEETFVKNIKRIPGVVNATYTFNNMIGRNYGGYYVDWEGKNPNDAIYFEGFGAGYDFIETMGMHVLEGRSFSRNFADDSSNIILNESAVKSMHLQNPIGKNVTLGDQKMQIIGIVKDFHYESLHEPVKPSYIVLEQQGSSPWFKIMVRIKKDHQEGTIRQIQNFYESYNPGFPFTFGFLSDVYQKQYDTEVRVSMLSRYFCALAIIISCLGLFGLASYTFQKRQKEIGIRKAIGATSINIAAMLTEEFLKLIAVSVLIAFPVSWLAMSRWLQSFAYHISIGPGVFLLAAAVITLISLLTISLQSIKAAIANPVSVLRAE